MSERRRRRRVVRRSDAPDIDRSVGRVGSVDGPDSLFGADRAMDAEREVLLDPEAEEHVSAEQFWREQRPPHY